MKPLLRLIMTIALCFRRATIYAKLGRWQRSGGSLAQGLPIAFPADRYEVLGKYCRSRDRVERAFARPSRRIVPLAMRVGLAVSPKACTGEANRDSGICLAGCSRRPPSSRKTSATCPPRAMTYGRPTDSGKPLRRRSRRSRWAAASCCRSSSVPHAPVCEPAAVRSPGPQLLL